MTKNLLLVTASVVAMCAGGGSVAMASPIAPTVKYVPFQDVVLYTQNSNDSGTGVGSQNFTSGSTQYNSQGADDFVVPKGHIWRITEIDVTGQFFNSSGPATSEDVIFYKNGNGLPGNVVATFNDLNGTGGPDFAILLPGRGLRLKAGKYWMSVVENADEFYQGQWGWEVAGVLHGKQAMWQNPGGGFGTGCKTWGTIENCVGSPGPDFMFTLRGKIR